jgi:SAM-dependent methyltransferase
MYGFDHRPDQITVWSPYNKIEVGMVPYYFSSDGRELGSTVMLRVQNLFYQWILNLSDDAAGRWGSHPFFEFWRRRYDYPYSWKSRPSNVLILGAGTGNDVAAALRNGARHVDAVEIDPDIIRLGSVLHPEHPYADSRVHLVADDARAVLRRPGKSYDLIVFGLLDSHLSFYSSLGGNIRLDNYVYTVDSFRQALDRLAPDGILSLSFYMEHPWLLARMVKMVETASGRSPFVMINTADTFTLVTGPGASHEGHSDVTVGVPDTFVKANPPGPLAEDDWPFLYLQNRTVPMPIIAFSIGALVITALLVASFFKGQISIDRHFFFLGAGFLLLETRTIAQLALLFGTTWRVSALTIATILVVILLANLIIQRSSGIRRSIFYVMLFVALLANYFVPIRLALGYGALGNVLMAALLVLPLFFAALVFASSVAASETLSNVLASNLIGAVLGGILENVSLVIGISGLSLLAMAVYGASYRSGE